MPQTPTLCPDASLESPGQGRASSPSSLVRPSSEAHVQSGPAKPAPKAETRSERPLHAGTRASTASADTDVTAVPRGRAATLRIRGSLHACPPGQSSRVDGGLCTEALPGKETQSRLCLESEEAARTSTALRPAPVPCAPETFSASPSPRPAPGGGWWAWPTGGQAGGGSRDGAGCGAGCGAAPAPSDGVTTAELTGGVLSRPRLPSLRPGDESSTHLAPARGGTLPPGTVPASSRPAHGPSASATQ